MLMTAIEATVATIVAREKIAEEKRIKKEQRQLRILEVTAKTIEYCETILANNIQKTTDVGYSNIWYKSEQTVWFDKPNADGISNLIIPEKGVKFADGSQSYVPYGQAIIPAIIIDYLKAHGYIVEKKERNFHWYGMNWNYGYSLEISWGN